ncbi:PadR family transcriptional regulator [Nocardiopsis sp. MG754419]|uniref:PadR family transcriptional regulator n=1 Tax=Nocardiopsis sp. MG754419 TaxID=2259865 RepID=UPI001BAC971C|nr:PadR family transcriptional regulator [Nocardiopsis sp. MG754419]MBR8742373.1 PadR family transcriptional regulator [Nocardiopsis sp. MG754419]
MAHVILGMLLITPQSLYDLIKSFEAGVSLFYSASSGSIKRALDGLLARGHIEVASVEAGARGRKVYRVTDAGHEEFRSWMLGEPTGPDTEVSALSRLYFLGLIEPDERAPVLRRITERFEADLARLTELDRRIDARDIPEEYHDILEHQRATLAYGIAAQRFAIDWFRAHTERLAPPDH